MDASNLLNIILSVSSITLSITAIIFSWVTYRNSSKMQMDAQAILEKITQKVEVIVQSTTNQIDKAWNYFTNPSYTTKDDSSKALFDIDSIKQKIVNETKSEVSELIKNTGIDKETIAELSKKVEFLVQKTTNVTEEIILKQTLINNLRSLKNEINAWAIRTRGIAFSSDYELDMMITFLRNKKYLADNLLIKLNNLLDIRNKIIHDTTVNSIELQNSLSTLDEIRKILKDGNTTMLTELKISDL